MITRSQLATLYPRATAARLDAVSASAAQVLPRFGIDKTHNRMAFFFAQLGHESGGMTIVEENLNYSAERLTVIFPRHFPNLAAALPFAGKKEKIANLVYGNKIGNGPPESGDGFRYRGRGLIQLTGRANYKEIGRHAGVDLEANPDAAAAGPNLLLAAATFWDLKNLNATADADDFRLCTRKINGGTIGMPDRLEWLDKARRVLATVPPKKAQPSAAVVIAVQKKLLALGFAGVGAADGQIGPKTAAAIEALRLQKGLPKGDPKHPIDNALLQALELPA